MVEENSLTEQHKLTYYTVNPSDRFSGLCRLLDSNIEKQTLIFCRTKRDVDYMNEKLDFLKYSATCHHSDLNQKTRERNVIKFAEKKVNILIVTEIPKDLVPNSTIHTVIFSVLPIDPDAYIQKVYRLATLCQVNEFSTLVTPYEIKKIGFIKKVMNTEIQQAWFEAIDSVIEKKVIRLNEDIHKIKASNITDYDHIIKMLLETHAAEDILKGLFHTGFKRDFSKTFYKKLNLNTETSVPTNGKLSHLDKLFIAVGKSDDVDDEGLIDFIHSETKVDKTCFEDVKVFDSFSFFLVPKKDAEVILEIFKRKKRGKRSIVERAKGEKKSKG